MKKPRVCYDSEIALCAAFMTWAKIQGWTPYAETAGWDVLLVHPDDTQIGVQAKLRFNMKVLRQTIPDGHWDVWREEGPDFRAVLLPAGDDDARAICGALGITAIWAIEPLRDGPDFVPKLGGESAWYAWHYWNPARRHALPDYVPDVAAGASGPVQLTHWKVAALRITAVLDLRGYVTRADFRRYGIDPRRWYGPAGWLDAGDVPGQFKRGAALAFDAQHPTVYAQIRAEVAEELPKVEAVDRCKAKQGRLVA